MRVDALTLSSRHFGRHPHPFLRRHHRLSCPLPLRLLPRPVLLEERHRLALNDPNSLRRGIVVVFCSCPDVTLCRLAGAAGVSCGCRRIDW